MGQIDLGKVRGTQIYTGVAVTGSNAIGIVFPSSGIVEAYVGDLYINTNIDSVDKGNIYDCVLNGDASTAKWSYRGNIRGPKADVVNNLESTSVEGALSAYQGKRLYDMMIEAGVFSKKCSISCGETAYGVKITMDNVDTKLTFVVNGSEYTYSYNKSGTAQRTTLNISIGGNIGMSSTGGNLTEIRSSAAYIYAFDITNGSSERIYSKNMELWETLNEMLQTHDITGSIIDGSDTIKTGMIYKFLKGVKTLLYPITHAKAVWYKKSSNITVYDQIEANTNSLTGKAPTSHASSGTSYGKGSNSYYGHVKLSDSISSTSAEASGGTAATPKAVKTAYDLAATMLPKSGGTLTGAVVFDEETMTNGAIYATRDGELIEILRVLDGDEPTVIINDGFYGKSIGTTRLSGGKTVELLIPEERVVLEGSNGTDSYTAYFRPRHDNKCTLGTSALRFARIYAGNATISTSDRREKENIIPLGESDRATFARGISQIDIHSELFDRLQPVQFNFIDGDGKVCYGLIAQDVISAMEEVGIGENELDLIHHNYHVDEETGEEKETFGIAYSNIIALLIHEVQKLKTEVSNLKE